MLLLLLLLHPHRRCRGGGRGGSDDGKIERTTKRRDEDNEREREGGERSPAGMADVEGRSSQGWLQGPAAAVSAAGFYGITRGVPTTVHRGMVSSLLARVSALP